MHILPARAPSDYHSAAGRRLLASHTNPSVRRTTKASASVGAPGTLFLMRGIGTPWFGLVEHVNAFVNEREVGIDFVDFGCHVGLLI